MQQLEHRAVGADALQPRHIPWDEGDDDKDRAQIKKIEIRQITELVARTICLSGVSDSAAAMVTISAPINENMVISIALSTAPKPLRHKAAVIPQPRNAALTSA